MPFQVICFIWYWQTVFSLYFRSFITISVTVSVMWSYHITIVHIDITPLPVLITLQIGMLVQERRKPRALAMELRLLQ